MNHLFRALRILPFKVGATDSLTRKDLPDSKISYSWILSGRLAIGPIPRTIQHWQQLENAGFRCRFSCCYPDEHIFAPVPHDWTNSIGSLPDHRNQEQLTHSLLAKVLDYAEDTVLNSKAPVYLHCFAGQERSTLLAVALTHRVKKLSIFEALEWVRRCHPPSKPLYSQLVVLEQILHNDRI